MSVLSDRSLRRLGRWSFSGLALAIFAFLILPLVCVIWVAFFANKIVSFPPEGYTIDWFKNALAVASFRDGFLLSLRVSALASLSALALGIPAALLIGRRQFPGRSAIMGLLMSPLVVPGIVGGAAIYMFFIEWEVATEIQMAATLPGLMIAHTVIAVPWTMRVMVASLVSLDPALEEASMNLGANRWVTLFKVVLPVARPAIVAAALLSFVISFIDLELSLFLVGPGRTTLPIAIVSYLQWTLDPTICAVATIQIVLIGSMLLIADRFVSISKAF
ncbi:MAG: ABC transporter permease [Hyphomicrobiales bacterium]|nr:MAG: ABC transporter permease [Hyphomicrobiales bacterium]